MAATQAMILGYHLELTNGLLSISYQKRDFDPREKRVRRKEQRAYFLRLPLWPKTENMFLAVISF